MPEDTSKVCAKKEQAARRLELEVKTIDACKSWLAVDPNAGIASEDDSLESIVDLCGSLLPRIRTR